MRGGHDLGGRQGFGPVHPEPEDKEPVFHDEWERRVFAMTMATGMLGHWNIDQSRHARERQHPADYLRQSYYENWLAGTEKLLLESGLVGAEEFKTGMAMSKAPAALRAPDAKAAWKILRSGGPAAREIGESPGFARGDRVLVRRELTAGHTRAPDYAQGCQGRIHAGHGAHVFPDANCEGEPVAHHLYSVGFDSRELWGQDAEPFEVRIDLWEPYLEAAADAK